MEIDRAIRHADKKVILVMVVVFGLLAVAGLLANGGDPETAIAVSATPVAPSGAARTPKSDAGATKAQFASFSPKAKAAERKAEERWFADESAAGSRPDAPR